MKQKEWEKLKKGIDIVFKEFPETDLNLEEYISQFYIKFEIKKWQPKTKR